MINSPPLPNTAPPCGIFDVHPSSVRRGTEAGRLGDMHARFFERCSELRQFPVSEPVLPSRTPQGHNAGRWAGSL
jgi:hypothetical protein